MQLINKERKKNNKKTSEIEMNMLLDRTFLLREKQQQQQQDVRMNVFHLNNRMKKIKEENNQKNVNREIAKQVPLNLFMDVIKIF